MLQNVIHFFTLGFNNSYTAPGIVAGIIIGVYFFFRLGAAIKHFGRNQRSALSVAVRLIVALATGLTCINPWSMACIAVVFPLFFLSVALDIIAWIAGRIARFVNKRRRLRQSHDKERPQRKGFASTLYWAGAFLAVCYAAYIGVSAYTFHHTVENTVTYQTTKLSGGLNAVFLSDIHFGTIDTADDLQAVVDRINSEQEPDVVILGGDITDDRTSLEDLKVCYDILGQLKSTYGTYFVYGNHDKQPYFIDYPNGERTYTDAELEEVITTHGITILEDEVADLGDVMLVGRKDYGAEGEKDERASVEEILAASGVVPHEDKLIVVVDHQPVEIEESARAGADIELCGHTHAGQMIPFGLLYKYMGPSQYVWGEYNVDGMDLYVSSGLYGWGWPLRNEGQSEIVRLNIE